MESAGSPVWPPASFLLKMAKSSCLVCVCHCASVGGGGRGGGGLLAELGSRMGGHLSVDPVWTFHSNK